MAIRLISFFLFTCILLGASHIHAAIISKNVNGDFQNGGIITGMFTGDDGGDGTLVLAELSSFRWEWSGVPNLDDTQFGLSDVTAFAYNGGQSIDILDLVAGLASWTPNAASGAGVPVTDATGGLPTPALIGEIVITDKQIPEASSILVWACLAGLGLVVRRRKRAR